MERDVYVVDFEKLFMWERFESGYRRNARDLIEKEYSWAAGFSKLEDLLIGLAA